LGYGKVSYHKSNGITSMKKHVKIEYNAILKKFLDNVTNAIVAPLACEPAKKRTHVTPLAIFEFFSYVNQFKKDNETQIGSLEDLMFFMMKGYLPMKIIESIWFQRFSYRLCPG
jgi:hypothetical protein